MKSIIIIVVLVLGGITTCSSMYVVGEGKQALVTQFGQIQGEPVTQAGLHFKAPFIQDIRYFDKRILSWDGDEEQIPTKDKKYIWVDTTARWKIKDSVKFAQTVRNEAGARDKLDGILDGVTRDTISNHNLVEAVRYSNKILEQHNDQEIEKIEFGREELSKLIIERARTELLPFGIELIDVQLRRISYEKSVEDKVYNRMISERKRVAEEIRSTGKGETARIKGKLNRDLLKIQSEAYRKSEEIKGRAEAEAIAIYAESLKQDPSYYEFLRTMKLYEQTFQKGRGKLVVSTDAAIFKLLNEHP